MNCSEKSTDVVPTSTPADLFTSDSYRTEQTHSPLKKVFCWSRFCFYWSLFRIVCRGAKMAKNNAYTRQGWFDLSVAMTKLAETHGGKITVNGLDNIRKVEGPVVYVANHMSMLETVTFPCLLLKKTDLCITMKKQLFDIPLFGTLLSGFRTVSVTRENPIDDYKTIIREGSTAIKEGYSMLIFPQSTRTTSFNPEEFNSVGVKLARKAGVPVIPVALKTDFWKTGRLIKELGPLDRSQAIHFEFGEPITIESRNGKPENEQVIEFIKSHVDEWQKGVK